jgi:hypothetical protein
MEEPPDDTMIAGMAALAICESILIALTELGIISGKQEWELLEDAAESHRTAMTPQPKHSEMHRRTVAEIQRVIDGRKTVWNLRV